MDRFRQKSKKDAPMKFVGKDKMNTLTTDVKSMKEHLKIKEILRTVKMNSSMRIKAPRGSKIMHNKDFNENDDFDESSYSGELNSEESPSATNIEIVITNEENANETKNEKCINDFDDSVNGDLVQESNVNVNEVNESVSDISIINASENEQSENSLSTQSDEALVSVSNENVNTSHNLLERKISMEPTSSIERPLIQSRERKLSLDQTMLNRRDSFSQSELDLHSIGKSPLERKSSFFRKKLENFFKNTTEIFKRQSLGNKSELHRRGSLSMSLQSLNEDSNDHIKGSSPTPSDTMLQNCCSASTVGLSSTSLQSLGEQLPPNSQDQDSLGSSQSILSASQLLTNKSSESIDSLTEEYIQEAMLNSRAISMSSGLDTALGTRKRKTSRSNRVTWLASESLTNYFRRVIQDEKNKTENQVCHSYQDLSSIPENRLYGTDSKGRRLSYQRAVSGEDPLPHPRYQDTSLRKRGIPEYSEFCFVHKHQGGRGRVGFFTTEPVEKATQYSENSLSVHVDFEVDYLINTAYTYAMV